MSGALRQRRSLRLGAALGATILCFGPVLADPAPDRAEYSLLNLTPNNQLRSFCTDRPTKSTGPCTEDAGLWQLESDLYKITVQRGSGVNTTTEIFTNPTLKLGVNNTLDLEAQPCRVWVLSSVDGPRAARGDLS